MNKAPELFAKSPFPIVSIFDMLWWISFTLRWTNSETRVFRFDNNYSSECFNNNVSFFGSDDFQYWSMFNHDKKIKDTPESFKYVLKDLIYSYDKNVNYRDNMLPLPSSGPTNSKDSAINSRKIIYDKVINNELPLFVDTNFNIFPKEYVENNTKEFIANFDDKTCFTDNDLTTWANIVILEFSISAEGEYDKPIIDDYIKKLKLNCTVF
jgi:hypothetical protein